MCFAPQRRALFRHLNFKKCSEREVSLAFSLANVLRIWPAGSAPAALASLLSTLRSDKSLEKHSVSRLSYLFAHLDLLSSETFSFVIFFLLFSSLTLPISAFHLSILLEVCLLNFLRLQYWRVRNNNSWKTFTLLWEGSWAAHDENYPLMVDSQLFAFAIPQLPIVCIQNAWI